MLQAVTKLVQIQPATPTERAAVADLSDEHARKALAGMLRRDIDEWCKQAFDDGPRSHLGASVIGYECGRHLWFLYHWIKHTIHPGQLQRLFQRGHLEEDRVIQYLRGIGCAVEQVAVGGEQQRIYAVNGHFGGSSDGKLTLPPSYGLDDFWFLLECKTANKKEFAKMCEVAKNKPEHFKQASVYGYKLGLKYALYIMVCKDDDDMHIEIVPLDWAGAAESISRAEALIYSPIPPPRISNNPSYWVCKMCDHHGVCQLGKPIDQNCRSCYYGSPSTSSKEWHCNAWKVDDQPMLLTKDMQLAGCKMWTGRQL